MAPKGSITDILANLTQRCELMRTMGSDDNQYLLVSLEDVETIIATFEIIGLAFVKMVEGGEKND